MAERADLQCKDIIYGCDDNETATIILPVSDMEWHNACLTLGQRNFHVTHHAAIHVTKSATTDV